MYRTPHKYIEENDLKTLKIYINNCRKATLQIDMHFTRRQIKLNWLNCLCEQALTSMHRKTIKN